MNTPRMFFITAALGTFLSGCNIEQTSSVTTVNEECASLVNAKYIGQNGAEVCVTTPLSKSDTSIAGTIVGVGSAGPFMVTALTSDGDILRQATTLANGDFTMTQLNLSSLPGKGISFSVFVNGISSPPTRLVVGQEPAAKCVRGTPNYPLCGTYPGAIFFPIKTSITTLFSVPSGDTFGGSTLLPYLVGLNFVNWRPGRAIGHLPNVPAPLKPGEAQTVYATVNNEESFAYPVTQTVLPGKK
ncbi:MULTISPECIES: hypothetical protein [Pseudomonas]|uniref:hypothetical protein n=1 Tax=Pseudomonas sp. MIL9 TaxID=2807620 RepID=UPI001CB98C1F|nr:hypothetical protein [Pseudomonas sp. MIL9]